MHTALDADRGFAAYGLSEPVQNALAKAGYDTPTAIQAECIPLLLDGRDLIGQAQTGSGKTAAFALPLLSQIDPAVRAPQVLVLAPTRELAGQVATSCERYGAGVPNMRVVPIYGGASYDTQLRQLRRGATVVVGTPGRIIDHMDRGTLKLDQLRHIVLDEADEMLRMGFIDDVDRILEKCAEGAQVVLFSATMPTPIRRIASRYLTDPAEVVVKQKTVTASDVRQRAIVCGHRDKPEVIARVLELEETDGVMIFVRTKAATVELAQHLMSEGHAAAALNGDMGQPLRERCVEDLKKGVVDVVVATDVAARGLDVPRISHVINADLPDDSEPYVHRIGRTGRAGRSGEAISLVAPAQRGLLKRIERDTRQPMQMMPIPGVEDLNRRRLTQLRERIEQAMEAEIEPALAMTIGEVIAEHDGSVERVALALAHLMQGDKPLLLPERDPLTQRHERRERRERKDSGERGERTGRFGRERGERSNDREQGPHRGGPRSTGEKRQRDAADAGPMTRYRIAVGHRDGVKPGQIVGAIANEAGLNGSDIGRIALRDDHAVVELPEGLPRPVLAVIGQAWVAGRQLAIEVDGDTGGDFESRGPRGSRGGPRGARKGPPARHGGSPRPPQRRRR